MGWFRRKPENRQSSYTDLIVDHVVARASGSAGAKPTGTGTLEAAAGCYGRAFASATVVGGGMAAAALTPEILMLVGRELTRSGEVLLVIDVDQGDVRLIPAVSFDVEGDYRPSAWRYRCELPGPHTTTTRTVAADGVVHVRINVAPREPWRGRAPLQVAHLAGRLDAELAGALGDEAAGPRGSLLPLPVDGEDPPWRSSAPTFADSGARSRPSNQRAHPGRGPRTAPPAAIGHLAGSAQPGRGA